MNFFPTFTTKTCGINLHYAKTGQGAPLVFIHGWANNWQGWIPLAQYLKKNFTLYLLDLPGFGRSDNLKKYSVKRTAFLVASFIKKISQKAKAIVGLSMGSFIAAEIAKNYPTIAQTSILIGPLLKGKTYRWLYKIVPLYLRIFNQNQVSRLILKKIIERRTTAYLVSKYFNMYKFNKAYINKYGTQGRKEMRIEAFIQMGLSVSSYNLEKTISRIKIPTLLVYGREDKIAAYKNAEPLLAKNKSLFLKVIPFAGHMVHWEQAEKLAKIIKSFLNGLEDL